MVATAATLRGFRPRRPITFFLEVFGPGQSRGRGARKLHSIIMVEWDEVQSKFGACLVSLAKF